MSFLHPGRYVLGIAAAAAILTGCGGSQSPINAPGTLPASRNGHSTKQSQTFGYTGAEQTFNVPTGVTEVTVTASGASGYPEAFGGLVRATIPVTPRESLAVFVGGEGGTNCKRAYES
jgi:hypothetical protein